MILSVLPYENAHKPNDDGDDADDPQFKLHLTEQEAKSSYQSKVSCFLLLTSYAIRVQTLNSKHALTVCAPQCVNLHVCVPASLWPVNAIAGPGW